jgi:hypothetical protein
MSEALKAAIKNASAKAGAVTEDRGVVVPAVVPPGPNMPPSMGQQQVVGTPPAVLKSEKATAKTPGKEAEGDRKVEEQSQDERLSSLLGIMSENEPADDAAQVVEDDDNSTNVEEESTKEKTIDPDIGEKGHKALAAMRVKNKEMAAEIERLKAGSISKEASDRLAELEEIVQKTNYQKSAKFIREHREPLRAAVAEAQDIAKEFGAKPEIVQAVIGMPLGKMLEVLKKSVPDPEARAIMLESLKKCSTLARNADAALAEAKTNYQSAMEEEEANITSQLNKTRDELFTKAVQELKDDKAVGFILERFTGDTADVKKYNGIVDAREERAKKVLFSTNAAEQVKFMVRGAIADDMIGMAKKWYERATKAEKRLSDIQKRKPGMGSASGEVKAPVNGGTLRDIAKGVAERIGTNRK